MVDGLALLLVQELEPFFPSLGMGAVIAPELVEVIIAVVTVACLHQLARIDKVNRLIHIQVNVRRSSRTCSNCGLPRLACIALEDFRHRVNINRQILQRDAVRVAIGGSERHGDHTIGIHGDIVGKRRRIGPSHNRRSSVFRRDRYREVHLLRHEGLIDHGLGNGQAGMVGVGEGYVPVPHRIIGIQRLKRCGSAIRAGSVSGIGDVGGRAVVVAGEFTGVAGDGLLHQAVFDQLAIRVIDRCFEMHRRVSIRGAIHIRPRAIHQLLKLDGVALAAAAVPDLVDGKCHHLTTVDQRTTFEYGLVGLPVDRQFSSARSILFIASRHSLADGVDASRQLRPGVLVGHNTRAGAGRVGRCESGHLHRAALHILE